jgi:Family of unknown function (DUF6233)
VSNGQKRGQELPVQQTRLPRADGPLVDVELLDGQHLYAVLKGRFQEADRSWWYGVRIHVLSQAEEDGRLVAASLPVDFRVPADRCEPVPGQDYGRVPTERRPAAPDWVVERPADREPGPAWIVHRGDCRITHDPTTPTTTEKARALLQTPGTAPCPICRPDRPLGTDWGSTPPTPWHAD